MAAGVAASISSTLTNRNLGFLKDIWQGGALAFLDKEVSGTKVGYLQLLGHLNPTQGGASFQTAVKSNEFIQAMATGVGVAVGEPISQIDPMIQVKLNAPSVFALSKLLLSTAPTQVTQAVDSGDVTLNITDAVTGVWYLIGKQNLTHINASVADTDLVPTTDYLVDTEIGAIYFVPGGGVTSGTSDVVVVSRAAVITNAPLIAPGAAPQFTYGGLYVYIVLAGNEARNAEVWLRYMPRARLKPSGNFDVSVDKPAEITLDIKGVPSSEISGMPFGWLKQIAGTMRGIQ